MAIEDYRGVLVFIEQRGGKMQKVSRELLGKGRELADSLGVELGALVLGNNIEAICDDAVGYGADRVYYKDAESLQEYTTEPYAQIMTHVINTYKPEIVLVGATSIGRDLGPRVSARIHTGLTADCTKLEIDKDRTLLMTRPAFGGNIMATIVCAEHRPQMSTVRPGVMKSCPIDESRKGEKNEVDFDIESNHLTVEVLEAVVERNEKMNIEDANVLISGGRGVGGSESYTELEKLATHLGGTVSASRAAVDSGWVDHDRQVGQTGKTVRPDVYFALGISGAIQHVAGMEDSELIIAVNKDPEAPIFNVADLGVVGDLKKIMPLVVKEIEALK
jgi:electron transfer flavoprotein alpha subunit